MQNHRPSVVVVLAAGVVAFGATAMLWGPSTSWDLRNYHVYDAWAWLHGRLDIDVAPAQLQTYFNPLLQVPFFLTATHWPSSLHLFVLGGLQGLNGVLLYGIGRRLLPATLQGKGPGMALATAFAGVTSATVLGQLGTTIGDNLVSIAALAALQLALVPEGPSLRRAALAGLLLGGATALKLALAPVTLGLMLAIVLGSVPSARSRVLVALSFGTACGFLLLAGGWMWTLWQRYGNPTYPLFAGLFHGPWDPPFPVRDLRFVPDPAWQAWRWPLAPAFDWRSVSEIKFRDLRLPALALAVILLPWWRRPMQGDDPAHATRSALLAGLALAYAAWLALFGYHRYLAVVEMLAPLALLILLGRTWPLARRLRQFAVAILAVLVLSTNPPNWGNARRDAHLLALALPATVPAQGALVLLAGTAPSGFLAPAWPEPARFVRVQSNFHGEHRRPFAFDRRVAAAIDAHPGPLVVAFARDQVPLVDRGLARFGVVRDAARCGEIETPLWPPDEPALLLCSLSRRESAAMALDAAFAR